MAQLIGQNLIVGISGQTLTDDEKKFLVKNDIGGVILMGRNVGEPMQVYELCNEIQSLSSKLSSKAPFTISIDMEGGRVHRLKPPFTQWPALAKVGDLDSANVAYNFAFKMGSELRSVGINLDFAPCVDVLTNSANTVIGDRSIGADPEKVAKLASALTRGYIKAGVIACAKHFPGHGNTLVDSHEDLPKEQASLDRLNEIELIPFKKVFKARLDLVMTSHLLFEKIDSENPVTFSSYFLKTLLRDELRYRGLVITDDLDMGALIKYHSRESIPVRALQAGCDILLYCNDPTSPQIAIDSLSKALSEKQLDSSLLEASQKKILDLKKRFLYPLSTYQLAEATEVCGRTEHRDFAEKVKNGVLPLMAEEA